VTVEELKLQQMLQHDRVVALGEIDLDYYREAVFLPEFIDVTFTSLPFTC